MVKGCKIISYFLFFSVALFLPSFASAYSYNISLSGGSCPVSDNSIKSFTADQSCAMRTYDLIYKTFTGDCLLWVARPNLGNYQPYHYDGAIKVLDPVRPRLYGIDMRQPFKFWEQSIFDPCTGLTTFTDGGTVNANFLLRSLLSSVYKPDTQSFDWIIYNLFSYGRYDYHFSHVVSQGSQSWCAAQKKYLRKQITTDGYAVSSWAIYYENDCANSPDSCRSPCYISGITGQPTCYNTLSNTCWYRFASDCSEQCNRIEYFFAAPYVCENDPSGVEEGYKVTFFVYPLFYSESGWQMNGTEFCSTEDVLTYPSSPYISLYRMNDDGSESFLQIITPDPFGQQVVYLPTANYEARVQNITDACGVSYPDQIVPFRVPCSTCSGATYDTTKLEAFFTLLKTRIPFSLFDWVVNFLDFEVVEKSSITMTFPYLGDVNVAMLDLEWFRIMMSVLITVMLVRKFYTVFL